MRVIPGGVTPPLKLVRVGDGGETFWEELHPAKIIVLTILYIALHFQFISDE